MTILIMCLKNEGEFTVANIIFSETKPTTTIDIS